MRKDSIAVRTLLLAAIVANALGPAANAQTAGDPANTIRIGSVELRLGLDEADVLERLTAAGYTLREFEGLSPVIMGRTMTNERLWQASSTGPEFASTVAFRDGRLVRVIIKGTHNDAVVPILGELHSLVAELVSEGRTACRLLTSFSVHSGAGIFRDTGIQCGMKTILINTFEAVEPAVRQIPDVGGSFGKVELMLSEPQ